jgi:hypothetical protein
MARSHSPLLAPAKRKREQSDAQRKAHKALLRDVSKQIGQPLDSIATRFVALARAKMAALEADPTAATVAELMQLQEALSAYAPRPQHKIEIEIIPHADSAAPDRAAVSGLTACALGAIGLLLTQIESPGVIAADGNLVTTYMHRGHR